MQGMTGTSREVFEEWLKTHHDHLKDYEAWEVAQLANACGFSMADISPQVSSWIAASRRRLRLWESPFFEKWMRATCAQQGKDYGEI
jgi:hypothetical protein